MGAYLSLTSHTHTADSCAALLREEFLLELLLYDTQKLTGVPDASMLVYDGFKRPKLKTQLLPPSQHEYRMKGRSGSVGPQQQLPVIHPIDFDPFLEKKDDVDPSWAEMPESELLDIALHTLQVFRFTLRNGQHLYRDFFLFIY